MAHSNKKEIKYKVGEVKAKSSQRFTSKYFIPTFLVSKGLNEFKQYGKTLTCSISTSMLGYIAFF